MVKALFFYTMLLMPVLVNAQTWPRVDAVLQQGKLIDFVTLVEQQTTVRFYFDEQKVQAISVSIDAAQVPLNDVLQQVLTGTGFSFTRIGDAIYVLDGEAIQMDFPAIGIVSGIADSTWNQARVGEDTIAVLATLPNKLYVIGVSANEVDTVMISGRVVDLLASSGVPFAEVAVLGANMATTTNTQGEFHLAVPKGRHRLIINAVGIDTTQRMVLVRGAGRLTVGINEKVTVLEEVQVTARPSTNVSGTLAGVESLGITEIRQTPVVFGEADVLRVVLMLPGVTTVGEASTGFNVRGGAADQNLILFNDKTIYNPAHFFGFFSAINPDVVADLELYKGGIPSRFGGRLSSVLDITSKRGNREKLSGAGGIGMLSSRFTLDGPLQNGKTTFLVGLRSTYSNWLLALLPQEEFGNSSASFYDGNFHLEHAVNARDTLQFSGYFSDDRFKLSQDTLYNYNNQAMQLKWTRHTNERMAVAIGGAYSGYRFRVRDELASINAYQLTYHLHQAELKADLNYSLNDRHQLQFGVQSKYYKLNPGKLVAYTGPSLVQENIMADEQALETAFYVEDHFTYKDKFSVDYGIRYSVFNALGPGVINSYREGEPKSEATLANSVVKEGIMKTYHRPDIRIATRYSFSKQTSLKVGFHTLHQFIHMLSNTATMAPTDSWKLSDYHIEPQRGMQLSLGLYRNFMGDNLETYVEVYRRFIRNYLDYKGGATLMLNPAIEQDVLATRGKSYGLEMMVRKRSGRLNGWVAYTYSRILLTADGVFPAERVNDGNPYPANYDRPHDVTFVGNYRFTRRFSISLNANYGTGRPITLPIARFDMNGSGRVLYSDRNAYRIPDYYRVDFSMNIEGNHKIKKLAHSSWAVGVYNVTGRRNAYSAFFVSERGQINGYQLSVFGAPIPFVTYNFKF